MKELMHIVEITAETAIVSTLPPTELTPYIRNKLYLVLKVLSDEIFTYNAGPWAPQWQYWCYQSLAFMRSNTPCDFDFMLCHVIEGFLQILGDSTKWTKRLLCPNVIATATRTIYASRQDGATVSH